MRSHHEPCVPPCCDRPCDRKRFSDLEPCPLRAQLIHARADPREEFLGECLSLAVGHTAKSMLHFFSHRRGALSALGICGTTQPLVPANVRGSLGCRSVVAPTLAKHLFVTSRRFRSTAGRRSSILARCKMGGPSCIAAGRQEAEDPVRETELAFDDHVLKVVRHERVVSGAAKFERRQIRPVNRERVAPFAGSPELNFHRGSSVAARRELNNGSAGEPATVAVMRAPCWYACRSLHAPGVTRFAMPPWDRCGRRDAPGRSRRGAWHR